MNFVDNTLFLILDKINPHAIRTWIKHHQGIIDYTAEHYAFFASRRSQLMDELKQSLLYEQKKFEFSQWRRIVSNNTLTLRYQPLEAYLAFLAVVLISG